MGLSTRYNKCSLLAHKATQGYNRPPSVSQSCKPSSIALLNASSTSSTMMTLYFLRRSGARDIISSGGFSLVMNVVH